MKRIYIEITRIFAMLCVIFNHTNTSGYFLYAQYSVDTLAFWINLFNSIFVKVGAPLFFFISGALILNKQKSIKSTLKKVVKYSTVLFIASLVYYTVDCSSNGKLFSIQSFLSLLYSTSHKYHLWFLYSYIAFLIISPVIGNMITGMDNKHFQYLIGIMMTFQILPAIEYIIWRGELSLNTDIYITLPINIFVLPITGYYIENRINIKTNMKSLIYPLVANAITIVIISLATYLRGIDTNESPLFSEAKSQYFYGCGSIIQCVSIFYIIKYISVHISFKEKISKTIEVIGSCIFGIYLIHPLIKERPWMWHYLINMKNSTIPPIITGWIYMFAMFIFSLILVLLFKYGLLVILRKTICKRKNM